MSKKSRLNMASKLLLPGIGISESVLVKLGLKSCFIGDEDYDGDCERCLFLLFQGKDPTLIGKLINHVKTRDDYDVGEFTMIVVDWPEEWEEEWDLYLEGMYSKFRPSYKEKVVKESPLQNEILGQRTISNGHLIVHKHTLMKEYQESRIGQPLEEWQEVASVIDLQEEVFQYERFKAQINELA